ncbi:unnamed protein product [Prorocentrum cordatum]|uniref:Uncharacterized protein n=1 Tax=Prorocentrum cordatum TaxID=2364126 RepID=A0ABN9REC7_9DINO|nr:unnamed protein product [Polarella glacialis]
MTSSGSAAVRQMFERQREEVKSLKVENAERMRALKEKHAHERSAMGVQPRAPKKWFPDGLEPPPSADFSAVEDEITKTKAALDDLHVVTEVGERSAADTVRAMKTNFYTNVLATVECHAWSVTFAANFLTLVRMNAPKCCKLSCYAVEGGPACKQEVQFMIYVLPKIGLQLHPEFPQSLTNPTRTHWRFFMGRSGAKPFYVNLIVYPTVADVSVDRGLAPWKMSALAPNLHRIAVVSCPVEGRMGENINDVLNERINESLTRAALRADAKGFVSDDMSGSTVAASTKLLDDYLA